MGTYDKRFETIDKRRLPDIILNYHGEKEVFQYDGEAMPLSKILSDERFQGRSIFLTGVGGAGKSFSLYSYFIESLTNNAPNGVLYIDMKMLEVNDRERAILSYIEKNYALKIDKILPGTILLLDGINEAPYGLRIIRKDESNSYLLAEIKALLGKNFRLILGSRSEYISIEQDFPTTMTDELRDFPIVYCKLSLLREEQVCEQKHLPWKSIPKVLLNNQMLSMYLAIRSEDIQINNSVFCAGDILDKYMEEFMRKKFRRIITEHEDDDLRKELISYADETLDEIYRNLMTHCFEAEIPIKTLEDDREYIESLGILCPKGMVYIWADELYQQYFLSVVLYFALIGGCEGIAQSNGEECAEKEGTSEDDSEIKLGNMYNVCSFFVHRFFMEQVLLSGRGMEDKITANVSYPFQTTFDVIQLTGEMLLTNHRDYFETLMNAPLSIVYPNSDEGKEMVMAWQFFRNAMYYLVSQNYYMSFHHPNEFYNGIQCGLFCKCATIWEIRLHPSVIDVGIAAFYNCLNLEKIEIGPNVKRIGELAFGECTSLENVKIIASKKSRLEISEGAFFNCKSLKSIYIPASAIMGRGIFFGCDNLSDIYCESISQPDSWDQNWLCCNAKVHWGYKV